MLKKEQNDLLTQTGPGMPMGRLFRSHWLPVLLASELPENECPPVRVKLLSPFRQPQLLRYLPLLLAHSGGQFIFDPISRLDNMGQRTP
jgi:hypothetical protein